MKNKIKLRWLSILLAAGLLSCHMPFSALAYDEDTPTAVKQEDNNDKSGGLVFSWMSELPKTETVYTAGGGQITWTPVLEEEKVVSGTLLLKDAVINSTQGGLKFPVSINIIAEGNNQITSNGIGICLLNLESGASPKLTITGPGSLSVNSQSDGIQAAGGITVDTAGLEVMFGNQGASNNGLRATQGDVTIKNCASVKIKSNPGIASSSDAVSSSQSGNGTVRIENSHAVIINENGEAVSTIAGKIELISSHVRVIGNTSTESASGTLNFNECIMDGGTLFAQNLGNDLEIPSNFSRPLTASNSAVIYGVQASSVLPLAGDCIWYTSCSYDEETDKITIAGGGYSFGDVIWNDNMCLVEGKTINIGLYSPTKDSSLTIPEGTTVDMPAGSKLNVRYSTNYHTKSRLVIDGTLNIKENCQVSNYLNCSVINNGSLNIQNGGSFYNYYDKEAGAGGVFQNKGSVDISQTGILQNRNRLENSGTINSTGNFSTILMTGYNSVIENTGEINGFIIERHDDKYVNTANGKTVITAGQTLTLGEGADDSGTMNRILKVPEGAELTIEEGAAIDAKANAAADTVLNYIDLSGILTLHGSLVLPDDTPDEILSQITDKIIGNGEVNAGSIKYIIVINMGDATTTQLIEPEGTVSLPKDPARDGYLFSGWYVKDGTALKPFDPETRIQNSMEIISKWVGINEWTTPLSIEDWTYGEAAKKPKAEPKYGEARCTYSDRADGTFSDTVPEKAGTWYVKAFVAGTDDYTQLESDAVSFKIEPKQYTEGGSIVISEIGSAEDVTNIIISDNGKELIQNTDYTVTTNESENKVTITITFQGNYTGTAIKTYTIAEEKPPVPVIKVSSIKISGMSNKIAAGKKIKLTAKILPANAANKKLIWKSSNPKVATVSAYGLVTVKKSTGGKSVTITASAADGSGKKAAYKITSMKGLVSKVTLSGISGKIAAGKQIKLTAKVTASKNANKRLTWKSGNTKVATVSSTGMVTIKKNTGGKRVTITASATDGSGKKASYTITSMKGVVKKIAVSGKTSVKAGKTIKLTAKVTASKNANKKVIWKSGNKRYATVSSTGKVTAKKAGKGRKVKITAMAVDGSGIKRTVTIKIR